MYKLKEHVTSEMLKNLFTSIKVRYETHDDINFHIPEMICSEYDLWINLENRSIDSYGFDEDIIREMKYRGWVEEV